MNEPLHPLTLSEILDRTAQLYRSRFLVFLGIATIPAGTIFIFAAGIFAFFAWMGVHSRHGASVADIIVWAFLVVLLILVIPASLGASALGEAAMCQAASQFFLGEKITIRGSYSSAWKRGWRYTGLFLLQALVTIIGPAVLVVGGVFAMIAAKVSGYANNDPSPLFGGLFLLLIVIVGSIALWMLLRVCLAFPACVVEQTRAWPAFKRGNQLSNGTRSRILLLYVLGLVLNQILAWAVTIPGIIALALIPGLQGQAHAQTTGMIAMFLVYGSMFMVRAITKPIYGIALTLFYYDQRIRKEGFDIEWLMQQAGMVPPAAAAVPESEIEPLRPEPVAEVVVALPVLPVADPVLVQTPQSITAAPEEGKA